ncbi:uncharacterized protein Dwil_GK16177 [Drosophila willistoni]|uniref:Folded gastrulation N-terminal domain-containing protein n=1 Tax=Drosophila willistoni TaxID=7260 RepID=B4N257_DROWI|nr:uncharacterized protein Dwil_GK16177 [Drosophila willistoni]
MLEYMEYMSLLRLLVIAINWSWPGALPVCAQYTMDDESYLNGEQRPLWILEDQLMKREREDRPEADYITSTRAVPTTRRQEARSPASITFLVRAQHLPIFDNAPGDNALTERNYPIFIYNGTKGELIVNTMLSHQRYPMKEPVPGQVLYPPSTPMFRPRPIVERFRVPGHREMLNLTLIPFYAHEAITTSEAPDTTTTMTTTSTTTTTPTPLTSFETQLPRSSKRKKRKRAKQYSAYYSPEQVVQWQPSYDTTINENHRHFTVTDRLESLVEENEEAEEEEDVQEEDHEQNQNENESKSTFDRKIDIDIVDGTSSNGPTHSSAFHIVYVDESLEPPAISSSSPPMPPIQSRQSSRYALKREYFAFPVYTLGKLLQSPSPTTQQSQRTSREKCTKDCTDPDNSVEQMESNNTWFILNSR